MRKKSTDYKILDKNWTESLKNNPYQTQKKNLESEENGGGRRHGLIKMYTTTQTSIRYRVRVYCMVGGEGSMNPENRRNSSRPGERISNNSKQTKRADGVGQRLRCRRNRAR